MIRGRRSNRARLLEISKQQEITAFMPPEYAVRVAHERIGGMVEYFWRAVQQVDFITALDYVDRLAQSAYLQGVNDAAVAAAMQAERQGDK